jgi:hypothetical protein
LNCCPTEHHPQVASFLHGYSAARRRALVELLREGVALGDLPPRLDADLTALVLGGPILYCRMMTPEPFPSRRAAELVDSVLSLQAGAPETRIELPKLCLAGLLAIRGA